MRLGDTRCRPPPIGGPTFFLFFNGKALVGEALMRSVQAPASRDWQREAVLLCWGAGAVTYHLSLEADRGLSWEAAAAFRDKAARDLLNAGRPVSGKAGFYIDKRPNKYGQGQTGGALAAQSIASLRHLTHV